MAGAMLGVMPQILCKVVSMRNMLALQHKPTNWGGPGIGTCCVFHCNQTGITVLIDLIIVGKTNVSRSKEAAERKQPGKILKHKQRPQTYIWGPLLEGLSL